MRNVNKNVTKRYKHALQNVTQVTLWYYCVTQKEKENQYLFMVMPTINDALGEPNSPVAGNPKALAFFPQCFAADSQPFGEFGFREFLLVFEHEAAKVVFQ